jgi:fatty acid desaturase
MAQTEETFSGPDTATCLRARHANGSEDAPASLTAAELRALATLHPINGYRDIAIEWAAIGATIWTCIAYPHPLLYLLGIMIIGARQHALLILLHDGAHRLLSRSARTNDLVGELCLAWPFVIIHMRDYRVTHFLHHRFVNTHDDPDWTWKQAARWPWRGAADRESLWHFPTNKGRMIAILSANLFLYGFWTALRRSRSSARRDRSPKERPFFLGWLIYQIAIFGILSYEGWLLNYVLFWIVPMITWLQLCMLIRGIAEHFSIDPERRTFGETRTTIASTFDKIFFVSRNIGFHIEHHLHPFIPYYALPKCHEGYRVLDFYDDNAHVTHGYFHVMFECIRILQNDVANIPRYLRKD